MDTQDWSILNDIVPTCIMNSALLNRLELPLTVLAFAHLIRVLVGLVNSQGERTAERLAADITGMVRGSWGSPFARLPVLVEVPW